MDPGDREQFTAGASGIMFLAGIGILALSSLLMVSGDSPAVFTLSLFLVALGGVQTLLAFLIVSRHGGALRFLLHSLGERRRLRRSPPLLSHRRLMRK